MRLQCKSYRDRKPGHERRTREGMADMFPLPRERQRTGEDREGQTHTVKSNNLTIKRNKNFKIVFNKTIRFLTVKLWEA